MNEQVNKPKEDKSRAVANVVAQKKSGVKQDFGFVDNRSVPGLITSLVHDDFNVTGKKEQVNILTSSPTVVQAQLIKGKMNVMGETHTTISATESQVIQQASPEIVASVKKELEEAKRTNEESINHRLAAWASTETTLTGKTPEQQFLDWVSKPETPDQRASRTIQDICKVEPLADHYEGMRHGTGQSAWEGNQSKKDAAKQNAGLDKFIAAVADLFGGHMNPTAHHVLSKQVINKVEFETGAFRLGPNVELLDTITDPGEKPDYAQEGGGVTPRSKCIAVKMAMGELPEVEAIIKANPYKFKEAELDQWYIPIAKWNEFKKKFGGDLRAAMEERESELYHKTDYKAGSIDQAAGPEANTEQGIPWKSTGGEDLKKVREHLKSERSYLRRGARVIDQIVRDMNHLYSTIGNQIKQEVIRSEVAESRIEFAVNAWRCSPKAKNFVTTALKGDGPMKEMAKRHAEVSGVPASQTDALMHDCSLFWAEAAKSALISPCKSQYEAKRRNYEEDITDSMKSHKDDWITRLHEETPASRTSPDQVCQSLREVLMAKTAEWTPKEPHDAIYDSPDLLIQQLVNQKLQDSKSSAPDFLKEANEHAKVIKDLKDGKGDIDIDLIRRYLAGQKIPIGTKPDESLIKFLRGGDAYAVLKNCIVRKWKSGGLKAERATKVDSILASHIRNIIDLLQPEDESA